VQLEALTRLLKLGSAVHCGGVGLLACLYVVGCVVGCGDGYEEGELGNYAHALVFGCSEDEGGAGGRPGRPKGGDRLRAKECESLDQRDAQKVHGRRPHSQTAA